MSKMLKSTGSMGGATLFSRVLGMGREMAYASFMGTGMVADAFNLAFMIPSLFRRLLGEGALTAAFIPIFKAKEKTESEKAMWAAANAVLSGLVVVATLIVGLAMLGITLWLSLAAPTPKTQLMLELLRLMFPYMLLVCVAAVLMGMLNARGYFFIPAMGATTLNVVLITIVVVLLQFPEQPLERRIFALAVGVLVAGVAQAVFQLPVLLKQGYRPRWVTPWKNETVRRVVTLMVPGTLGVAAFQINILVTQSLAFGLGESIVSSFGYAVRLMELPQGVFGISLATFLLPALSGLAAEKKFPEFRAVLREGAGYLLLLNGIAAVLLFVLAEPIVRLLFQRNEFGEFSTYGVALALRGLAPGLIAFSLVNILARAFYAVGDTTTPMRISVVCLFVNVLVAVALMFPFKQLGLGLANSITATLNAGLLMFALRKKIATLDWGELRRLLPALTGTLVVSALVCRFSYVWWRESIGHADLPGRLGEVFVPMSAASLAYFGLAWWLKIPAARALAEWAWKRTRG